MLVNVVYKGSPATDAEFTYNAFNQKVLESVSSAPEDLVLAWDGGQYLGSTPVGTDLKTARLNVDGVAIAELVDSDIRVDYLVDALGSVTGVTNASGSVKRDARYSPYGTLLSGNQFEWGWTGNTGSRNTGVPYAEQYNWNRHYSSRTKQWISRDILWPQEHAYGYVKANPMKWIDPKGMKPKKPKIPKLPIFYGGGTVPDCITRDMDPCEEILLGLVPRAANRVRNCIKECGGGKDAAGCWAECLAQLAIPNEKDWPIYAEYLACIFSKDLNGLDGNPCSHTAGVTIWRQECCDMWFMHCVLISCKNKPNSLCLAPCLKNITQCYLNAETGTPGATKP